MMTLASIRIGDFLYHAPTNQGGMVEAIEDDDGFSRVTLDGEKFLINEEGFRLWWDVERSERDLHCHAGDVAALRAGKVQER